MSFLRRFSLLLAAPVSLLTSCVPDGPAASSPAPSTTFPISRDINTLGKSIALPRRPLVAVWQMKQMGDGEMGPSDYSITAVMQFSPRDLKALTVSAAKRATSGKATTEKISVLPWFPEALRKKAATSKGFLKAQSLDPSDFYKMSFIQGSLHRIEGTNSLVLALHTN